MTAFKGFKFFAVALSLVTVISAGIVSHSVITDTKASQKSNSFSLTSSKVTVNTEFTPSVKFASELLITGYPEDSSKKSAPYYVGSVIDPDLNIKGSNIDKVTYSVSNAAFMIDKDNSKLYGIKEAGKESIRKTGGEIYWDIKKDSSGYYASLNINGKANGGAVSSGMDNKTICSEFSVDYKNCKSDPAPFKLLAGYCNNSKKTMSAQELDKKMINDITVTVTAAYTDGTSDTKTICLNCSCINDNNIKISSIIQH